MTGKSPLTPVTSGRALSAARMLVASYFIAHATGVIVVPEGMALVPRAETATVASWATITVVWLTGIALFVGRIVRPAALILALYTIVAALFSHAGLFTAPIAPQTLWVEIAMVGALSLIALTAGQATACGAGTRGGATAARRDEDDELSRTKLELAATRAALAEIQATDNRISYPPSALRRTA